MMSGLIIAGMFGPTEIAIIILVLVLLFGGRKIPELMRGLGQGMKEFKKATKEEPPKTPDTAGTNKELDS